MYFVFFLENSEATLVKSLRVINYWGQNASSSLIFEMKHGENDVSYTIYNVLHCCIRIEDYKEFKH
jgi:hypothetical protein